MSITLILSFLRNVLYTLANFLVYTGCCVIAIIVAVHVTETLNELQSCLSNNNVSDLKVIRGGLGSLAVSVYYPVEVNSSF